MFFPRLRRHAKWMFLFLALAFALGFVGFGVGAGGVGVGDILRGGGGGSGVPSISDAEKRTFENPKDAQAFRDLSTAYQAAGRTDEAIQALEDYSKLRPKDTNALRDLAGLYLTKASNAQQRAQIYQFRSDYLAPAGAVDSLTQIGGRPLDPFPISSAVTSSLQGEISSALSEAQSAAASAVGAYRRIAAAKPKDLSVQLELAQAAQSANDTATAIAAYETFLRLAPDDPTAPEVQRLLKQLRASSTTG